MFSLRPACKPCRPFYAGTLYAGVSTSISAPIHTSTMNVMAFEQMQAGRPTAVLMANRSAIRAPVSAALPRGSSSRLISVVARVAAPVSPPRMPHVVRVHTH
jgi:hypothetical protein